MKILVVNGANLNMLKIREPEIYGNKSYKDLVNEVKTFCKEKKVKVKCVQSNFEGEIVEFIQKAYKKYDGIVINAGGYTHTSVVILDALKCVGIPTVEVHISDVNIREDFRKKSYISEYAEKIIVGEGFNGYIKAIEYLINK